MSKIAEITDEMRDMGELLMSRWGYLNDGNDDTESKSDTIEAMCLLFPEASDDQIAVVVSMANGSCHKNEISEVRH